VLEIVFATLAIFLLIFVGTALLRSGWLARPFWSEAEKLIYYVLFPALLLSSTASADLAGLDLLPMAGTIIGVLLLATVALLALRPLLTLSGPAFTSVYQGVIRMNTYLAFAVAYAVAGQPGVEATAVTVAVFVPTANLLCVTMLVRYGAGRREGSALWRTAKAIVTNPLIVSILIGMALNLSGLGLPPVIGPMLETLGRASIALGLLAVGAGLDFQAARTSGGIVALATLLKLAAMPALAYGLAQLLGVDGLGLLAIVALNAMPTSAAAYILARQLGGDAPLMASIVTVQTALSMASLPVVLGLLS
jgi:malonate transporter and related proteins